MFHRLGWSIRALTAIAAIAAAPGAADDWPQFRGPNRDAVSRETGLMKEWKSGSDAPRLLWTHRNLGTGYSSPAVVGDRLYITSERTRKHTLICLEANSGKEVWSTAFGGGYDNRWGGGPRGTPTVSDGVAYVLGAEGTLAAIDAQNGKILWTRSMQRDLNGRMMSGWGYSESVLIDDGRLICTPGGGRGTMAALDRSSGEVVWRSVDATDPAAYASIVVSRAGGVKQYVNLTGAGVIGIAADDGRLLWRHVQNKYRTAVCASPVVFGDYVFASADYNAGCDLLHITPNGDGKVRMEPVYAEDGVLQNHHGGLVFLDGYVYGSSGNCNSRCFWKCLEVKSKREAWSEGRKLEAGSITCADGMLYLYGQAEGTCVLLSADSSGWNERGRMTIPEETKLPRGQGRIWTHPVVSNGKLFLRDLDLLFCYDISAK